VTLLDGQQIVDPKLLQLFYRLAKGEHRVGLMEVRCRAVRGRGQEPCSPR
jgi:hypothetical protein